MVCRLAATYLKKKNNYIYLLDCVFMLVPGMHVEVTEQPEEFGSPVPSCRSI